MNVHIPTAREFELMHTGRFTSIYEMMDAFATAHCEAQRQAILENASLTAYYGDEVNEDEEEGTYKLPYSKSGLTYEIEKSSVINAYPLTNIR